MLENIKSNYFKKLIFTYIYEEIKLKIIKYNKNLQKDLDISLLNYKLYSNKYIIYEANNKVKEYNIYNDQLIYEGEYLNGKRNGKGKEYDIDGISIFEGEYLNGKRNGKGKEYYKEDGILIFSGEYLNGKRWNGMGFNQNGEKKFELKNGKGFVEEGNRYNDFFKGEYLNGERNGKGKEYDYMNNLLSIYDFPFNF